MKDAVQKAQNSIFVCEGVTRVDALAHYGIPSVGITGVGCWRGRNAGGGLTALPDWNDVNIKGGKFIVAADADVRTNKDVAKEVEKLRKYLIHRGADTVLVLLLPPDAGGLDDWIVANGPFEDYVQLLNKIAQFTEDGPLGIVRSPEQWDREVRTMFEATPDGDAVRLLVDRADSLLLVREPKGEASLRMLDKGVWRPDTGTLHKWIRESCEKWASQAPKALMSGKLTEKEVSAIMKHALSLAKESGCAEALKRVKVVTSQGDLETDYLYRRP